MLTPFPSTLIYGTLVQLQEEVRANRKSIPSSLDGGSQEHIGLGTYASIYACINPNYVFTCPSHPGPLVQIPNATQLQIAKSVGLHKEIIGKCNIYNLVKLTIIQKINTAVDS